MRLPQGYTVESCHTTTSEDGTQTYVATVVFRPSRWWQWRLALALRYVRWLVRRAT